ncbi:MAG: hypothetical protein BWY06_03183 [Candidatus Latescibacteria bacterium ADurb.Bin168]|nr:MAG: hypothetical protein BWY06_03183 [Candidatus Latescibacteria bacterium ADurb.Bin168]
MLSFSLSFGAWNKIVDPASITSVSPAETVSPSVTR